MVVVIDLWSADLAAKHGVLVAQHDDLEVVGAFGAYNETCKTDQKAVQDSIHEESGWRENVLVSVQRHFPGGTLWSLRFHQPNTANNRDATTTHSTLKRDILSKNPGDPTNDWRPPRPGDRTYVLRGLVIERLIGRPAVQ